MGAIQRIVKNNKEVLVIDYSNLKEAEMIEKVIAAKDLILAENKPVLLLSIYNDKGYATPSFMSTIERETRRDSPSHREASRYRINRHKEDTA